MTDIENAIEILKRNFLTASMCVNIEDCKTHNQAIRLAIEALREKQEREKN